MCGVLSLAFNNCTMFKLMLDRGPDSPVGPNISYDKCTSTRGVHLKLRRFLCIFGLIFLGVKSATNLTGSQVQVPSLRSVT